MRCSPGVFGSLSFGDLPLRLDLYMRFDFLSEISVIAPALPEHESRLSWFALEDSSDGRCDTPPFALFSCEFVATSPGERIEPGFTVVFGDTPLRRNELPIFEAL